MSSKPIFVATHPRACSTAFERVFMTRRDILQCSHEPFGDAFYFGPERLSNRYEDNEVAREESGFSKVTYKDVLDSLENVEEGKRLFIKDIAHYLFPPNGGHATIAESLRNNSLEDPANNGTTAQNLDEDVDSPTVIPVEALKRFHFAFLIRHPSRAIPSYYRCTVPPLNSITGFNNFMSCEAGYLELRTLFDFLNAKGIVGPALAGEPSSSNGEISIAVVDADDMLDKPAKMIEAFCKEVGIEYKPEMLFWDTEEDHQFATEKFEKWIGFHDDAIQSTSLRARAHAQTQKTREAEDEEWRRKFGDDGQKAIRSCVDESLPHYEYLRQFAMKV